MELISTLLEDNTAPSFTAYRSGINSLFYALCDLRVALPPDLAEKVKELKATIENYDYDALKKSIGHTVSKMEGTLARAGDVKRIVEVETQLRFKMHRIKLSDDDDDPELQLPDFDAIGLSTTPEECVLVTLTRDANSRSEFDLFQFVLMPGHIYMSQWNTLRASGDGFVCKNEEFAAKMKSWAND